jgi:hypothetical protein
MVSRAVSSVGPDAAEHRQTCWVSVKIEYSSPLILPPEIEVYPGPPSKPRRYTSRRLEWFSHDLALNSRAPMTGEDVKALGVEIGEVVALQMYRDPLSTMLIPLLR